MKIFNPGFLGSIIVAMPMFLVGTSASAQYCSNPEDPMCYPSPSPSASPSAWPSASPSPSCSDPMTCGGGDASGTTDGGMTDGGMTDGGMADGGMADGGMADGGMADGGMIPSCEAAAIASAGVVGIDIPKVTTSGSSGQVGTYTYESKVVYYNGEGKIQFDQTLSSGFKNITLSWPLVNGFPDASGKVCSKITNNFTVVNSKVMDPMGSPCAFVDKPAQILTDNNSIMNVQYYLDAGAAPLTYSGKYRATDYYYSYTNNLTNIGGYGAMGDLNPVQSLIEEYHFYQDQTLAGGAMGKEAKRDVIYFGGNFEHYNYSLTDSNEAAGGSCSSNYVLDEGCDTYSGTCVISPSDPDFESHLLKQTFLEQKLFIGKYTIKGNFVGDSECNAAIEDNLLNSWNVPPPYDAP